MKRMSKEVVVVGGGAAGMMAAITAAEQGAQVRLLEPNERLGKKRSGAIAFSRSQTLPLTCPER